MPEEWTTFTPTTVQIGDRVHARLNEDAVAVTTMQRLSGGGRRLYLAGGSIFDFHVGSTVAGFRNSKSRLH